MSLSLSRPCSSFLPRRFYRFCFPRCTSSSPSSPLFYVSQYFPFNLSSFSSIFPGPSRSCRLTRRAMFLSRSLRLRLSLSLYFSARMRRVSKAHRHHAISFAAGPPRIQVAAGPEMSTERRKRLQTGTGGNDSVAKAMAMAMAMATTMAMARTATTVHW